MIFHFSNNVAKTCLYGVENLKEHWNQIISCTWHVSFTYTSCLTTFNPFMNPSPNGQTHFKSLAANAARFLKCVWLFKDVVY